MVRFGMVAAALALMASPLLAQESADDLKKELEQLRKEVDALKAVNSTKEIPAMGKLQLDAMAADDSPLMTMFKGTKLSGHVDAAYGFSFNQMHTNLTTSVSETGTSTGNNPIRAFDNQDHSFYLHAMQLNLERLATKDLIVGYHVEIVGGHDVAIYESRTITDTNGDTSAANVAIGLQEAWIQILAPLGNGLDIRIGKMASLIGYEVLENTNNINYSRGVVWGQIEPITATGIRATYSFTEMMSATIGLNNGKNQAAGFSMSDTDHGKMFEAQYLVKPSKDLWIAVNLNAGQEFDPNGFSSSSTNDWFYIFNIVAEWKMDKLTLAVNFDKASIQGVATDAAANGRGPQSGLAIYLKYQATDTFATAIRAEYMSDEFGAILSAGTGVVSDRGTGARVITLTFTQELKVAQHLILRFEFRHDSSNQHIFVREDSTAARGDNSVAFEALLPF